MARNMMEIQIAASVVRDVIQRDKPLEERIKFAMDYVRKRERDLFWMSYEVSDDLMFRTALAAVMMAGDEEDRSRIERSMKPLQMLAAAMQGVPVDFGAMPTDEDLLPLMKMWHASKSPAAA